MRYVLEQLFGARGVVSNYHDYREKSLYYAVSSHCCYDDDYY